MDYQYVFYWNPEDYYLIAFGDIINKDYVYYVTNAVENNSIITRSIHSLAFSDRVNKRIKIPLKEKWNSLYIKSLGSLDKQLPTQFVFHGSYYWMKSSDYFSFLKQIYPSNRIVMLLMDTIESYKKYFAEKYYGSFDVSYIKQTFDRVLTYNLFDSEKYGLEYYPSIYSKYEFDFTDECNTDVFFIGKSKNRIDQIHQAYENLTESGLKCDFYVTEVDETQKKYADIHYNQRLCYLDVLKKVVASKGLLEIVQEGSNGFTFRLDEALVYDKNIITNNPIIDTLEYRNNPKVFRFTRTPDIDANRYRDVAGLTFDYKGEYSPNQLIQYLEKTS